MGKNPHYQTRMTLTCCWIKCSAMVASLDLDLTWLAKEAGVSGQGVAAVQALADGFDIDGPSIDAARRIAQDGTTIASGTVSALAGHEQHPAGAAGAPDYLVVWEDHRTQEGWSSITGRLVDTDGTLYTIIQTLGDTLEESSSQPGIVNK